MIKQQKLQNYKVKSDKTMAKITPNLIKNKTKMKIKKNNMNK